MHQRRALLIGLVVVLSCGVAGSARGENTSDWLKRILDPTTIGVQPFPGSTLNRKISVDTIRYEDPSKRIAVYMVPIAETPRVIAYFAKLFGMEPKRGGPDAQGVERATFELTGAGGYPPQAKGLQVTILRSPWVDGMTQIQMTFTPPASREHAGG